MPEYLAPGVYVEETSFRARSIEGVSTTTTGFIGPTRYGPLNIEPEIVTSLVEFERTYGGRERLRFLNESGGTFEIDNYLWHAVRAFFEEGGRRLYVSRVFHQDDVAAARAAAPLGGTTPPGLRVLARFPGRFGEARVTFTFNLGQNLLTEEDDRRVLRSVVNRDVVWINNLAGGAGSAGEGYYLALWDAALQTWRFGPTGDLASATLGMTDLSPATYGTSPSGHEVRVVTVTVTVEPRSPDGLPFVAADLPLDPGHQRAGTPDSLSATFEDRPTNPGRARSLPIVVRLTDPTDSGVDVLNLFFAAKPDSSPATTPPDGLRSSLERNGSSAAARSVVLNLTGGNDGRRPRGTDYEGTVDPATDAKTGLRQFEDLEDISIVAAPGSTFGLNNGYDSPARAITGLLIAHADRMRYRIAVLDCGNDQTIAEVRAFRAQYDSKYAALYYPWVRVLDPLTQNEINLPPSGFVAGIYARSDVNRAVYKAPANEVVNLALGFERLLNKSQQEVLNPEGINCFRFFEGRGMRLWGARTISSDPEWKYVNLRRYFAYLERSIDRGTQWAVFEPNGELLWANVRRTIEDFLLNEWTSGALLGDRPERSFFVKCDRSTMTQNDLDNGRLICLIGVAPLRPAEFVIFRIGQWTADRRI
jgi:hypothetical protein